MHFLPWSITLIILSSVHLATAVLPPGCTKVLSTLSDRVDSLAQSYQTEICSKGCQPAIDDWDQWTYQHAFLPFVNTVTTEMGLSSRFRETFIQLGEQVAAVVKRDCGPFLKGKHFCAESEALNQWGRCFKRNFVVVAMKNSLKLLPLVTSEICRGEYTYLEKDELWEVVLPGYMKDYARTCKESMSEHEEL
ncbi:hypothetical protein VTN77DRAFT_1022 [Rasamsonia byssochlamydoides]|uniref:uncharacterized protein n=1 Tax=Rasamsonia byssochlamydoides TaxID=89139 RepID=UPI003743C468